MAVFVTILAVVAAGIYFAGYADDVARLGAKKYYVGKAKAEAEALGMVGGEAAQGFLKGEFPCCIICLLHLFGVNVLVESYNLRGWGAQSVQSANIPFFCRFIEEEPCYG